jgi:hypothetical protein
MTVNAWLKARAVELGAALCTAAVLIGGLAIGVPFLLERIPQVWLYSFCCVSAVLVRAAIDLALRASVLAIRRLRPATVPAAIRLEPSGA